MGSIVSDVLRLNWPSIRNFKVLPGNRLIISPVQVSAPRCYGSKERNSGRLVLHSERLVPRESDILTEKKGSGQLSISNFEISNRFMGPEREGKFLTWNLSDGIKNLVKRLSGSKYISKVARISHGSYVSCECIDSSSEYEWKTAALPSKEKSKFLLQVIESKPIEKKFQQTAIFSGSSNRPLAQNIANCLGITLGRIQLGRFADGEVNLKFRDSIRGKDVYIIQPTSPPVNENLVELLLMISTLRRSSAKIITAVIPYYGYARQDRKLNSRVPISAADVARMIECMGVDRVLAVDLHCGQIQGFFGPRVPVDNLEALAVGLEYFGTKRLKCPVVVSPDAGGVYKARKFQQGLKKRGNRDAGIAMIIKQRVMPNEIERMDFVGSVEGCDAVIVDDMIDTAGTLCEAAEHLKKQGARRVFAFATHGLFTGDALQRINKSSIEEVIISDSIEQSPEVLSSPKITQLSIAVLIADAICKIHQELSLEDLFPG